MNKEELLKLEQNKNYQKSELTRKLNLYISPIDNNCYLKINLLKFDTPTINGRIYPKENLIGVNYIKSKKDLPRGIVEDVKSVRMDTNFFFKELSTEICGDYLVVTIKINKKYFNLLKDSDTYYYPIPFFIGLRDNDIVSNATLYGFGLVMVDYLNFGEAIELIKEGKKVSRLGWNSGNMHLQAQFPDEHSKMTFPYLYLTIPEGTQLNITEGERRLPWQPAQVDVFSNDWMEV